MDKGEIVFVHPNSEDRVSGILQLDAENRTIFLDYILIQIDKRFDEVKFKAR